MVLTAVNQLWVADITYIPAGFGVRVSGRGTGRVFTARAVGWSLSQNLQTKLPLAGVESGDHRPGNRHLARCIIPTAARSTPATITT